MNYKETLDWLYARLPMFSRIGAAAIKPDLTNTIALCAALDNPQESFPSIHIAGTNGKGSTSHMLAAILMEAGYKTGLYTSPHLLDFRERIRIDGKLVPQGFVVDFVARNKALIESIQPSFFEITVAMAFAAFAAAKVEIAVIETGLGGRLDSTNIIHPILSIITNVTLDHTDLLGKDIPSIAREKAGIIKHRTPVVLGKMEPEALAVMRTKATVEEAEILEAPEHWDLSPVAGAPVGMRSYKASQPNGAIPELIATDLVGSYQSENIATVLTAVSALGTPFRERISHEIAFRALRRVKQTTGLRGRWDVLQMQPLIIADVAHNPAGIAAVLEDWRAVIAARKHIVLGFVRDKDVRAALALFPAEADYHFCAADTPRALPAHDLEEIAAAEGLKGRVYNSVAAAVQGARAMLYDDDALLITGSFFIVGEALAALEDRPDRI